MKRALIVEDDLVTRESLTATLEAEGCTVDHAADGEVALRLLTRETYDVVLLDIVLPKMSGTEVMEELLEKRPKVLSAVIVVTGVDVAEIRKLFPNICDALAKPLQPTPLLRAVRHCQRSQAARGAA